MWNISAFMPLLSVSLSPVFTFITNVSLFKARLNSSKADRRKKKIGFQMSMDPTSRRHIFLFYSLRLKVKMCDVL